MRRQIILEIEEEGTENIVADIIGMMRDKVDMNCEFRISQKILPEKISEEKEIKIPVFFQNSCVTGRMNWSLMFREMNLGTGITQRKTFRSSRGSRN